MPKKNNINYIVKRFITSYIAPNAKIYHCSFFYLQPPAHHDYFFVYILIIFVLIIFNFLDLSYHISCY